jgi:hypothetical protein
MPVCFHPSSVTMMDTARNNTDISYKANFDRSAIR